MSGDELWLDVDGFMSLTNSVETAAEDMAGAFKKLSEASSSGLGSSSLDKAATHFIDEWSHGIRQIGEVTGEIAESMHATCADYVATDDTYRSIFQQIGGMLDDAKTSGMSGASETGNNSTAPSAPSSLNLGG